MGILARLSLQNFRNYECLDFELGPGVTVLVGDNGQGKSNFLEAVYFLAVLRSFRCQQLSNLYRWGTGCFVVRGVLQCEDGREVSLAVQYDRKRQLRVAGQPVARASEFIGNLFTVAFVPEDIELIKGAAGTRRRFLDLTLCQMYPRYLTLLQEYAKAHKSRNMLLRHDAIDRQALSAFDRVMAERGASIIDYRYRFFEELSSHQDPIAGAYCGGWPLRLNYRPSVGNDPSATVEELTEQLMEALLESLPRDQQRGQSHVGPHRDDYLFMLEDKSLHQFGSEGQCRTAALICKLATAQLLCAMKNRESVVLLVDDVIGELDSQHREAFFSLLTQGAQTLFACTDPGLAANFESPACYRVSGGTLV